MSYVKLGTWFMNDTGRPVADGTPGASPAPNQSSTGGGVDAPNNPAVILNNNLIMYLRPLYPIIDALPEVGSIQKQQLKDQPLETLLSLAAPIQAIIFGTVTRARQLAKKATMTIPITLPRLQVPPGLPIVKIDMAVMLPSDDPLPQAAKAFIRRIRAMNAFIVYLVYEPLVFVQALTETLIDLAVIKAYEGAAFIDGVIRGLPGGNEFVNGLISLRDRSRQAAESLTPAAIAQAGARLEQDFKRAFGLGGLGAAGTGEGIMAYVALGIGVGLSGSVYASTTGETADTPRKTGDFCTINEGTGLTTTPFIGAFVNQLTKYPGVIQQSMDQVAHGEFPHQETEDGGGGGITIDRNYNRREGPFQFAPPASKSSALPVLAAAAAAYFLIK